MKKIAIVTGGSSGIGRSVVRQLAAREIGVIYTYNRQPPAADPSTVALHLDLRELASFDAFIDRVRTALHAFGATEIHYLVNNAGMGGGTPFPEITEAGFDAMMAANFKGPFFLTQKLLPLLADGAHILNVSSRSASMPSVDYSLYGATKAALSAVTRTWAKELAPRKIRVNSISPGPVLTNLGDGAFAKHPEYIAPLGQQTLIGRIAEPDDIGEIVAALLSASCRYVTGADLDVSGGFML